MQNGAQGGAKVDKLQLIWVYFFSFLSSFSLLKLWVSAHYMFLKVKQLVASIISYTAGEEHLCTSMLCYRWRRFNRGFKCDPDVTFSLTHILQVYSLLNELEIMLLYSSAHFEDFLFGRVGYLFFFCILFYFILTLVVNTSVM